MAKKGSRLWSEIIALLTAGVIIATVGWFMSRSGTVYQKETVKETKDSTAPSSEKKTKDEVKVTVPKIVLLQTVKGVNKIVLEDVNSLDSKVVYTDYDEKNKIVAALGVNGKRAIIIEAPNKTAAVGDLIAVSLDGKADKELLQKNLPIDANPTVKPNSNQIMLISFSSAEKDFGFSLILENFDGSNKRIIVKNLQSVVSPIFSPDGSKIAFSSNKNDKSKLQIINLEGETLHELDLDKLVMGLSWAGETIYANVGDETLTFDAVLNPVSSVFPNKQSFTDLKQISPGLFVYKLAKTNIGLEKYKSGDVFLYDLKTKESKKLLTAHTVLGFLND